MTFEKLLNEFEVKTRISRQQLGDDMLTFKAAVWELYELAGEYPEPLGYHEDKQWQLRYWTSLFKLHKGYNASAARLCMNQIQRLRGRNV